MAFQCVFMIFDGFGCFYVFLRWFHGVHGFGLASMVYQGVFMVFHDFQLVFMVFQGGF